MVPSRPAPSPDPDPAATWALRLGTAVGVGGMAALVCAVPATLRVASAAASTEGAPRVAVALSAAALGPMIGSVLVLRGAREGLRAFAGPGMELRAYGAALWVASLLVGFSVFGSLLRATTHQHALAGVTFAFGALAFAVGSALVCARIVAILAAAGGARRPLAFALGALSALALAWVTLRFTRAVARDTASADAAAMVVDVLAFALCAMFAARPSFTGWRPLALVGPPVTFTIAILGLSALRDAPLRAAIDERAPAYSLAVDLIAGM